MSKWAYKKTAVKDTRLSSEQTGYEPNQMLLKCERNLADEAESALLAREVRLLAIWATVCHLEGTNTSRGHGRGYRPLGEKAREQG